MIPDKIFIIHWRGGKLEEIRGFTISEGFTRVGYGAGAIRAVDWYEEKKEV